MASNNDERTRNFLNAYLQAKPESETAKLMVYANPDPEKDELKALKDSRIKHHDVLPTYGFTQVTLLNRVKHTLKNLTTLLELTYSLERKFGLDKASSLRQNPNEIFYVLHGEILRGDHDKVKAELLRVESHNKVEGSKNIQSNAVKITKLDINYLRSLIHHELHNEFPSLNDKLYSLMKGAKTSFAYSTSDIRPVFMNQALVRACIDEIYDSLTAANPDSKVTGLRQLFYNNWFLYKPKVGRSTEKFAPYAEKLITATIACIGRAGTAYTKEKKSLQKKKDEAALSALENEQDSIISEVIAWCGHIGYAPSDEEGKGLDLLNFEKIYDLFLSAFRRNPLTAVGYLVRVAYKVNCDPFLVHIETMYSLCDVNFAAKSESDADFEKAEKTATKAVETFIGSVKDSISLDAAKRSTIAAMISGDDAIASERFVTAAFKVMSTRNLSVEVESRKKLSLPFESMLLEQFADRMSSINTDSANKDKSLIISTDLYRTLEEGELKDAFDKSHSDSEYGYIQKFTMSLMSICKISVVDSEGKSKVARVEDNKVIADTCMEINSVCNLVNSYIDMKSDGIKELKKAAEKTKKEKAKDAEKETSGRSTQGSSSIAMRHSSPGVVGARTSPSRQATVTTSSKPGLKFGGGLNKLASSSPPVARPVATTTTGGALRFGGAKPVAKPAAGNSSPGVRQSPGGASSPGIRQSPGGTKRTPKGSAVVEENTADLSDLLEDF